MTRQRRESMAVLCVLFAVLAMTGLAWPAAATAPAERTAPEGVILSSFTALWQTGRDGPIVVDWVTTSEADNVGFNLYRGQGLVGPWTKLNEDLIPTKVPPGSPVGSQYLWVDDTVALNNTYYYMLETLDTRGRPNRYGPAWDGYHLNFLPLVARGR